MTKKLLTLLLAVAASVGTMFASTKIGDLYYNLDATNQTAEVAENGNASGEIIIPSSVTYNSVSYSVTSIGNYAFWNCTGLTSVTIPNSVTSIGESAFRSCTGLTSITIPNSVTSIGNYAFDYCRSLTSIEIPNSVTSIGNGAFEGCTGLTSIEIPNSVTSIGNYAFQYCYGLTSVTIPNSVTSIGNYAFHCCDGLTSVTIGNSVTSIGDYAFKNCTGLTSVTIPNSVTSIGDQAFYGCTGLTSVTIPNSVTSIGKSAFRDCGLTSVTIGNSVTSIGNYAFANCTGLTSVTIPNSVTSIGESAFAYCTDLTSVNITDIAAWCNITFSTIDSNPLYYAKHLYVNNVEVTNLVIPNSVTSIGGGAFAGCSSLTSVTIPGSVTSIGNYAFAYCTDLTSVTIPNSVTSIGQVAFYGCTGLTSVTIPNSVTSIGDYAFAYCSGLTSVTCFATTPPQLNSYVFDGVDKSIPLYVPAGSVSAYKSADQWKDFSNILPIGAQPADVTTTTVTPSAMTADIAWPQVTGTATYTIEIKKNGELICTLTFNAQGQLISIAFNAPSRNNAPQRAQAAGFSFTVTSLDSGTTYSYTMTAKDSSGNVLKTESGTFTTTGDAQGIEDVQGNNVQCTKIVHNGQIYILTGDKTYTVTGQQLK